MLAIWAPKVGPIELAVKSAWATPSRWSSALRTSRTSSGSSVGVEIWKTVSPSSGSSTFWISASP